MVEDKASYTLKLTEDGNVEAAALPDVKGLHLTKSAVLLEVLAMIPSIGNGVFRLTDKDTEDYARLGNIGRIVGLGPNAFGARSPINVERDSLVGKFVLFNSYTGYQVIYKGTRLNINDDFNVLAVLDDVNDLDREFILSTF